MYNSNKLRLSEIEFPTDPLTIREIRRLEPMLDRDETSLLKFTELGEMLALERHLAMTMYARMIGDGEWLSELELTDYQESVQIVQLRRY